MKCGNISARTHTDTHMHMDTHAHTRVHVHTQTRTRTHAHVLEQSMRGLLRMQKQRSATHAGH